MRDWSAQSLRVVLFQASHRELQIEKIYLQAFGKSPESTSSNRGPGSVLANAQAVSQTTHGSALVAFSPGRIEVGYNPLPPTSPGGSEFEPQIHDVGAALSDLVAAAGRATDLIGDTLRLALHAHLTKPTLDITEANSSLMGVAPFEIPLRPGDTDFQIQINRPALLRSDPQVHLNRLLRLSVDLVQVFTMPVGMQIPPFQAIVPGPNQGVKSHYSPSVFMDWNTVPTGRFFEPRLQVVVLEDLRYHLDQVRLGQEAF